MGPSTIPNANDQAEYTELNSQIAEAEAKVAVNEALADSQERDLRHEGVTPYETARVTGKWREEARSAKLNIANMKVRLAELEAAIKPPARDPRVAAIIQANTTTRTLRTSEILRGGSPSGTGTPAGFQTVSLNTPAEAGEPVQAPASIGELAASNALGRFGRQVPEQIPAQASLINAEYNQNQPPSSPDRPPADNPDDGEGAEKPVEPRLCKNLTKEEENSLLRSHKGPTTMLCGCEGKSSILKQRYTVLMSR